MIGHIQCVQFLCAVWQIIGSDFYQLGLKFFFRIEMKKPIGQRNSKNDNNKIMLIWISANGSTIWGGRSKQEKTKFILARPNDIDVVQRRQLPVVCVDDIGLGRAHER